MSAPPPPPLLRPPNSYLAGGSGSGPAFALLFAPAILGSKFHFISIAMQGGPTPGPCFANAYAIRSRLPPSKALGQLLAN